MSFDPIKLSPSGAEIYYSGAYADATGATGAGGQYASTASSQGWDTVTFKNAATRVGIGSALPTGDDISTSANYSLAPAVVIGGTTPIGDVRGEGVGYIAQGGSSTIIPLKPNEFYSGALYATYAVGSTAKLTAKVGVGTVSFSNYYQGNFTTRDNYAFDTVLNVDTGNLNATGSGSGVYTIGDTITLQTSLIDRIGDSLNTVSSINDDAFVKGINVSILNEDKSIAYSNYKTDYKNPSFTFTKQENIDIFGSFTENFGVKFSVENQDGQTHETDFLLYGNRLSIEKIYVSASGGTYLDENKDNDYGPSTSDITSSDDKLEAVVGFSHRVVNTSGTTGAINFNITFDQDPNFTNYDNLLVFANTGSSTFDTTTQNLLGTFPLSQLQNQNVRISPDDGIVEGESNFFKFVASSQVGFYNELFTVGPYSIEPVEVGTDPILYNVGEQEIISGNLSILGQDAGGLYSLGASGSGDGQRLTGPGGLPYLLSGDAAGGGGGGGSTGTPNLQEVTESGNITTLPMQAASLTGSNGLNQFKGSTDDANGYVLKTRNYANDDLFNVRNDGHVGIGSLAESSYLTIRSTGAIIEFGTPDGYSIKSEEKAILGVISGNVFSTGSALLGGSGHLISGDYDVIAGGVLGTISGGDYDFIGGGYDLNVNYSEYSVVAGGKTNNIFSGDYSVIGGGLNNLITGIASDSHVDKVAIVGGEGNKVIAAPYSFIGAGNSNLISGTNSIYSSIVGGGYNQIKESQFATILGGDNNRISFANHSVSAGNYSRVLSGHNGAFVFSDSRTANYDSPRGNTLNLRFQSGVFVDTDSGIYINGNPVVTGSSSSEGDTLQTVTDRGNTTTTSILSTGPHISGISGLFGDRVGIGVTNPQDFNTAANALVVGNGVGHQGLSIFAGTSSSAGLFFADGAAGTAAYQGFIDYRHNNSDMRFGAAGGTRMVMNGNGLLIFPNGGPPFSPSAELEISSSAATIRLTDSDLTNHYSEIEKAGVYTYLSSRANAADGGFIFFGGATDTEFMRIDTSGKVGIGSNAPSAKLDVAGGIKLLDNNYLTWNGSNTRIVGNSSYLQFQVAASDKVRIQSDGNVGIGTNSPDAKLTVIGNISGVTGFYSDRVGIGNTHPQDFNSEGNNLVVGSGAGSQGMSVFAGAAHSASLYFAKGTAGADAYRGWVQYRMGDDRLDLGAAGGRRMVIDGNGVGIGTYTVDKQLTVSGNAFKLISTATDANNGQVRLGEGSNSRPILTLGPTNDYDEFQIIDGGYWKIRTRNTRDLALGTNNTDAICIKGSTQQVGISTTTPSGELHVYNGASSQSFSTQGDELLVESSDHGGISILTPNAKRGHLYFNNDAFLRWVGDDDKLSINTSASSTTIAIAESAGDTTFGGSVGIGTASPLGQLDIFSTRNTEAGASAASNYHLHLHNIGDDTSESIGIGFGITSAADAIGAAIAHERKDSSSVGDLYFSTRPVGGNVTERMRITATGRVGIGTTDPLVPLHVQGTPLVGYAAGDVNAGTIMTIENDDNARLAIVAGTISDVLFGDALDQDVGRVRYNHSSDAMSFYTNGSEKMRIKSGGDVGIGTNSPASLLHISGASPVLTLNSPSSDFSSIEFVRGATSSKWDINHTAAGDLKFRENTYAKLTLYRSNGRVGIGSEIPAYTLDVAGDIQAKDSFVTVGVGASEGYQFHDLGSTWGYKALSSPGRLGVLVQGVESMTFESNGRVGIGSTNPGHYKLEVIGDISGSGSFLGTGDGGRITNNHIPYLLSGDSPAENDTLQDVTTRGNTTTTSILSTGPHISGTTGLFENAKISNFNASDYAAFGHENVADNAYAIRQHSNGNTHINAGSSRNIEFRQLNSTQGGFTASNDFFVGPSSTSNTFCVDISETNVGIGTYAPIGKLTVATTMSSSPTTQLYLDVDGSNNVGGGGEVIFNTSASAGALDAFNAIVRGQRSSLDDGSSDLTFLTTHVPTSATAAARMTIKDDGKVGIGTTNPTSTLSVSGSLNIVTGGTLTRDLVTIGGGGQAGDFDLLKVEANNGDDLFRVNAQSYHVLMPDSDTKVGIGIASPQTLLDVDGAANHGIRIGSNNALIGEGSATGTQLLFWNGTSAYYGRSAAPFTHTVSNHFFRVGGSDQMAITSAGVGIGTATPAQKLHVEFTNADTAFAGGGGGDWGSEGLLIENLNTTTDTMSIIQLRNGDADFHIASIRQGTNDNDLGFFAEGSEKVRFTNAGYVGIGITNPTTELQVIGDISGFGNFLGTGVGNRITNDGTPYLLSGDAAAALTLQDVTDNGNTTTNAIIIENTGQDGFDFAPLTVSGAHNGTQAVFRGTGIHSFIQFQNSTTAYGSYSQNGLTIGNNGADAYITQREGARLYLMTSGEAKMTIMGDNAHSKVGIGTATPDSPAGSDSFLDIFGATDAGLVISSNNGTWDLKNTNPNADLVFYKNGSHRVTLSAAGNVGIGSAIPGRKLDVVGDAQVSTNLIVGTALYTNQWIANSSATQYIKNSSAATSVAITNGGSVGIGTDSPNETLHVFGTTRLGGRGYTGGASIEYASFSETNGGASTIVGNAVYAGNSNNTYRKTRSDDGNFIALNYNKGITFHTHVTGSASSTEHDINNHEQVRITTGGSVGIGTNDPLGTTHIYTADAGGAIVTNASHDDLIIENNGNCGIQLSSPASSYQYLAFGDTASANAGYVRYYHSDDSMVLRAGADDTVTIKGGDVRIGTNTNFPAGTVAGGKLDVRGDSDGQLLFDTDGGSSDIKSSYNLELWADYDNNNSAGFSNIIFKTDGDNERVRIDNAGNVGIGTNSPSYELDVIGTTRSTYYIGGAYFEENASDSKIKFYKNGTILVLDEDGQLKPSEKENDTLVFGVSKRDFEQPIVLGAEPVLITGPIEVGDYIVTSNKQGHGQAIKEHKFGTVIAQAMEKGDGESYNIKAMIRKM